MHAPVWCCTHNNPCSPLSLSFACNFICHAAQKLFDSSAVHAAQGPCSALNCDVQHSRPVCQSGKKLSSRASPGETRLVFYFDVGEHYSRDMTEEMLVITHSLECVYMWAHSECIHTTAMFEDVYILFDSCFIREKFKSRFYAAVCLIS